MNSIKYGDQAIVHLTDNLHCFLKTELCRYPFVMDRYLMKTVKYKFVKKNWFL